MGYERTLSIDTQGGSALLFGNLWFEYSKSLAMQHDEIAVLVENCPDVFLLMGYLPTLQSPGLNICARSTECDIADNVFQIFIRDELTGHMATSIGSDDREPLTVCLTRPPTRAPEESERETVVRNKAGADTQTNGRTSEMGDTGAKTHQTAAELNTVYDQKLKIGIDIDPDLWDQLKQYGLATLVEADDASRMGAGPSD